MPKMVAIITDWSEEERISLVRRWHPRSTVTRSPELDVSLGKSSDQECWYCVVTECEDKMYNGDGTLKTNTYMYKLTVEQCQKEFRKG